MKVRVMLDLDFGEDDVENLTNEEITQAVDRSLGQHGGEMVSILKQVAPDSAMPWRTVYPAP